MSWLYKDEDRPAHRRGCSCDECEGHTYIERHVPDDCLFDDYDRHHRYQDNPQQRKH